MIMRKKIIEVTDKLKSETEQEWLDLESLAEVELSSEDPAFPIEAALLKSGNGGWRAANPGPQTIRLIFHKPQTIRAIHLSFVEPEVERTQEYTLRWSADGGKSFQEVVRQQWNFSPSGATTEAETHQVNLADVNVLELNIKPHIGTDDCLATLSRFRIA